MKYIFIRFPKGSDQHEIMNVVKRMPTIEGIKFVFLEEGYDVLTENDLLKLIKRDKKEERS